MTAPAPHPDRLPDALTFFMTRAQRRAVLARLGVPAHARTPALLDALGLPGGDEPQSPQSAQSPQRSDSSPRLTNPQPPSSRPSRSSRETHSSLYSASSA